MALNLKDYDAIYKILGTVPQGGGYALRNTVDPLRAAGYNAMFKEGNQINLNELRTIVHNSKYSPIVSVTTSTPAGLYQGSHAVVVTKIDNDRVHILDPYPDLNNPDPSTGAGRATAYSISVEDFMHVWNDNRTLYFENN